MSFDYSKLRGRIREKYKTQAAFAEKIGISAASLSGKLNEKRDFTNAEVVKSCTVLEISNSDIPEYFFCERS